MEQDDSDDLALDLAPPSKPLQRLLSGMRDGGDDSPLSEDFSQPNSSQSPRPAIFGVDSAVRGVTGAGDNIKLEFRLGGIKDEGVEGKENQDDYMVWESEDGSALVMVVLDGHGRELGRIASDAAKKAFFEFLTNPQTLAALRKDAQGTMETAFSKAHDAVRTAFLQYYEKMGLSTKVEEGGYIVKKHPSSAMWHCVHGGTTASVTVVLDRRILISANVGDSTSLLCGLGGKMHETECCLFKTAEPEEHADAPSSAEATVSVLTADHGPENPEEFYRMRQQLPCPKRGKQQPSMLFVYDGSARAKTDCNSIFRVNADNTATVTNRGTYYKSVRNEWASLVTTPPHARFQDALAFTRSVGDLHLQVYGVSHRPDVATYDLAHCFAASEGSPGKALLIMCSDGIWDNWKYNDVASHFYQNPAVWNGGGYKSETLERMDGGKMDEIVQGNSKHTIEVAKEFMRVNKVHAHRNFGRHADNMCALVCMIYKE